VSVLLLGKKNSVTLIPNPTDGLVDVALSSGGDEMVAVRVEVFNVLGQNVFSWQGEMEGELTKRVDLVRQPNGHYLVKVAIGGEVIYTIEMLVKQSKLWSNF
jgi:hypothetical protein